MRSDTYGYLTNSGWFGLKDNRMILFETEDEYYSMQREEETICTENCMPKTKTLETM